MRHEWEIPEEENAIIDRVAVEIRNGRTVGEVRRRSGGGWSETDPYGLCYGAMSEMLRLAEENHKQHLALLNYEGIKRQNEQHLSALDKALCILASTAWESFRMGCDFEFDLLREELEAAGLIEMLPDQTWSLTELGGRVCRRES